MIEGNDARIICTGLTSQLEKLLPRQGKWRGLPWGSRSQRQHARMGSKPVSTTKRLVAIVRCFG